MPCLRSRLRCALVFPGMWPSPLCLLGLLLSGLTQGKGLKMISLWYVRTCMVRTRHASAGRSASSAGPRALRSRSTGC
ncbi:hypothetical protein BD626DRAFT_495882 [Schizophyllum amplum]|uniref:Uncharacterized protein n=1 Tax=Schizophyllum amplum TaxID=97359 RepID=A0A550CEI1_9AGAR|nr:hypothetical protein BD626DRAFT_495882 [Auriculariopsis ampla]